MLTTSRPISILTSKSLQQLQALQIQKESGLFQSLGTINFVLFLKDRVKKRGRGGWRIAPHPSKDAPDSTPFISCYDYNWKRVNYCFCAIDKLVALC